MEISINFFLKPSLTSFLFSRCSDPTELGTHFSSVLCPACKNLSVPSLDNSSWSCSKCSRKVTETVVNNMIEKMEAEAENVDPDHCVEAFQNIIFR